MDSPGRIIALGRPRPPFASLGAKEANPRGTNRLGPVVRQGVLDWLANDENAFQHAENVAEHTAAQLPGETIEARAGEADVDLAIRDALATFEADEIIVALRPTDEEGLIESLATSTAGARTFNGIPVRYLVVPDAAD